VRCRQARAAAEVQRALVVGVIVVAVVARAHAQHDPDGHVALAVALERELTALPQGVHLERMRRTEVLEVSVRVGQTEARVAEHDVQGPGGQAREKQDPEKAEPDDQEELDVLEEDAQALRGARERPRAESAGFFVVRLFA